jgi:hypothetical protein
MDFSNTAAVTETGTKTRNLSAPDQLEAYFSELISSPSQLDTVASPDFHALLTHVQRDEGCAKRVMSLLSSNAGRAVAALSSAVPSLMIALVAATKKAI